jgi:hypothetical protein
MLDIRSRAKELADYLMTNGFNGFDVPKPQVTDSENDPMHYACVDHLYVDYFDAADEAGEYFDGAQLEYDFEVMLRDWFAVGDEKVQLIRSHETRVKDTDFDSSDGLIIVRYLKSCDELEVYRVIDGKLVGGDE